MKNSHGRVMSVHRLDSVDPTSVEALWRVAKAVLQAAEENGLEGDVLDRAARQVEDLEERIANTAASRSDDVATKLRVILAYEKDEAERRHWFPLLQSALADLERCDAVLEHDRATPQWRDA